MLKKKIFFLIGPTGIGKSAAAVSLAKKIKAEIISCDSMQVYRGMDVITSKASATQRRQARHHLLSVVKPSEEYNAARYRDEALAICDKLFKKRKVPLFVGGTGLYYSITIDGLFPAVPEDKKIRAGLYKEARTKGGSQLYKRLAKVDPAASAKIHPNDTKRMIRALEVFMLTGKPITSLQKQRKGLGPEYEVKIFGLNTKRELLYKKINARVERMFNLGLVAEVKRLLKAKLSKTASCAIGVKQLKGYFDGKYSLEEAGRLIQQESRRYAKRQLTWFRKDKRVKWINVKDKETPRGIAGRIYKECLR
ncbi:MAG: tRNA (adenosine(37)-N6)-dimethylallyltransferase MiaA [Candidatus Omnitrophica bacterium]|nr:tRNA (adenosine(37)-N6)-dimethylallyltransferase MiaA [Candidatus Omnitrophota bacterium]